MLGLQLVLTLQLRGTRLFYFTRLFCLLGNGFLTGEFLLLSCLLLSSLPMLQLLLPLYSQAFLILLYP